MMTKEAVMVAVAAALAAPSEPVRSCGCGRAYVAVCGERAEVNAVAAACRKAGVLFVRKKGAAAALGPADSKPRHEVRYNPVQIY